MIRWSRHGISGAFNVFVVFAFVGELSAHRPVLGAPPVQKPCSGLFHDDPEVRHTQDSPIQLDPDNTIVTLTVISDTESIEEDHEDPHIESENVSPSYTESSNDLVIVNSEEMHTIELESPLLPLTPSLGTPTSLLLDRIELEVHRCLIQKAKN